LKLRATTAKFYADSSWNGEFYIHKKYTEVGKTRAVWYWYALTNNFPNYLIANTSTEILENLAKESFKWSDLDE